MVRRGPISDAGVLVRAHLRRQLVVLTLAITAPGTALAQRAVGGVPGWAAFVRPIMRAMLALLR